MAAPTTVEDDSAAVPDSLKVLRPRVSFVEAEAEARVEESFDRLRALGVRCTVNTDPESTSGVRPPEVRPQTGHPTATASRGHRPRESPAMPWHKAKTSERLSLVYNSEDMLK
ncbi:hypothetical protein THAOC_11286, partial [Thalassiosira oceanica]